MCRRRQLTAQQEWHAPNLCTLPVAVRYSHMSTCFCSVGQHPVQTAALRSAVATAWATPCMPKTYVQARQPHQCLCMHLADATARSPPCMPEKLRDAYGCVQAHQLQQCRCSVSSCTMFSSINAVCVHQGARRHTWQLLQLQVSLWHQELTAPVQQ